MTELHRKGKISTGVLLYFGEEGLRVEVEDRSAHVLILKIQLTPEQLSAALGCLVLTEIAAEVGPLEKIGKVRETDRIEFLWTGSGREGLYEEAKRHCPPGWEVRDYFGSRGDLFTVEGEWHAKATISRWS